MGSLTILETPCCEWQGARITAGYGERRVNGKIVYVHRWVIETAGEDQFGTLWDPALHVMHLCDNPPCFRFDHLRLGTHADNMADMGAKGRNPGRANQTHCKNGHEFTPENTYHPPKRPTHRHCRACHRGGQ